MTRDRRLSEHDRRSGERRRGRPRVELDLTYADALLEIGLTHRDVARELHTTKDTLNRRLADRRKLETSGLRVRCPECATPCLTEACPNGHRLAVAPAFLHRP